MKFKILYKISNLPIFQQHMYNNISDAFHCPIGDVVLVQDLSTGFVYNQSLLFKRNKVYVKK